MRASFLCCKIQKRGSHAVVELQRRSTAAATTITRMHDAIDGDADELERGDVNAEVMPNLFLYAVRRSSVKSAVCPGLNVISKSSKMLSTL